MAIGVKTTTTYFLKDYPNIPTPPVNEAYPYGIILDAGSLYYLIVSPAPFRYLLSGTTGYIQATAAGYQMYGFNSNVLTWMQTSANTETFIIPVASYPMLWTSHDIPNVNTGEVYIAGQPTENQEETTIMFPDLPKSKYQYAMIGRLNVSAYGMDMWSAIFSDEPLYFFPTKDSDTNGKLEFLDSVGDYESFNLSDDKSSWEDPREYTNTAAEFPIGTLDISGGEGIMADCSYVWSNYEIKCVATGDPFVTDEVFTPTPDEALTFPEAPADYLATYPYAFIIGIPEYSIYVLIVADEPVFFYPKAATGGEFDFIEYIDSVGNGVQLGVSEDASSWVEPNEMLETSASLPVGSVDGATYRIYWSNYDIKIMDAEHVPTDEIYESEYKCFIVADRYSAPETFFVGMADNVRRLTGSTAGLTIDRIESELDEVAEILALEDSLLTRTITEFSDETLEYVGDYAFYHCESLASVNLPALTSVGDYAFGHCLALTALDFPLLNSVGDYAFFACDAITTVSFPLLKEGVGLFRASSALTSVDLPSLTTISKDMFYNCEALTAVNAPNATSIGEYAFYGCEALESIVFPLATSVDCNRTFYNCAKLKSIDFRSGNVNMYNVSSYAKYHLSGCSSLEAYILRGGTAAGASTAAAAIFEGTPIASGNGYIYVKASEVDGYKSKWSTYADKIRAIEDFSVDGTATGELDWDKIAVAATATTDETTE